MSTHQALVPQHSFSDMQLMARAIAQSGLFGMKTAEQALALMLLAQADNVHPMTAARDYDIIQGRPAKKAEAMLRSFIAAGGSVSWKELTDQKAEATFSHPQGGTITLDWTMERAARAGLTMKKNRDGSENMYVKFPRAMLRSRLISEGVRTIYPAATGGLHVPEEVMEFDDEPINITTQRRTARGRGWHTEPEPVPEEKPPVTEVQPGVYEPANQPYSNPDPVALMQAMEKAETREELVKLGEFAATLQLKDEDRNTLKDVYRVKLKQWAKDSK